MLWEAIEQVILRQKLYMKFFARPFLVSEDAYLTSFLNFLRFGKLRGATNIFTPNFFVY